MASAGTLPAHSEHSGATRKCTNFSRVVPIRFQGVQAWKPLQETNGPPLLSNSQIAVASERKKNPEEQCITLQYIVTTPHLIRDLRKADLNFNQIKKTK
jgi:hypothetical protein